MTARDAPTDMRNEIERFCAEARTMAANRYCQLLRANLLDILRCAFPEFCRRYGDARVEAAAIVFLARHGVARPIFHELADEFVLFAQSSLPLDPSLLALLELEWVALAVEIHPAFVPRAQVASPDVVILNPTLRLLLLPFDLASDELAPGADRYPYAVFRSADHLVVTKPLDRADCRQIERLRAGEHETNCFEDPTLRNWTAAGLASGLVLPANTNPGERP